MLLTLIKSRENSRRVKYAWSEINLQRIQINFKNHALPVRWICERLIPECHKLKLLSRASDSFFCLYAVMFGSATHQQTSPHIARYSTVLINFLLWQKFHIMTEHYVDCIRSHWAIMCGSNRPGTKRKNILRDNIKWKKIKLKLFFSHFLALLKKKKRKEENLYIKLNTWSKMLKLPS